MKKIGCVSIIVPVYNVKDYLKQCMESILAQTYTNLEIILIDDGSTDGSGQMCEEYKEKDSRIKVIHQENGGLSAARNTGIKEAGGEYICFVDSDDYISEQFVEKLFYVISDTGADIVCSRHIEFTADTMQKSVDTETVKKMTGTEMLKEMMLCSESLFDVTPSVWDRIYRMDCVKKVPFEEGRLCEDILFSTLIFLESECCVYYDYAGYYYRIREKSIMTGTKSTIILKNLLEIYDIREKLLQQSGCSSLRKIADYSHFYFCVEQLLKYANTKDRELKSMLRECKKRTKRLEKSAIFCAKTNAMPFSKIIAIILATHMFSVYLFLLRIQKVRESKEV